MFRRGRRRRPRVQWLRGPGTELNQNGQAALTSVLENPMPIEIGFGTLDGVPTSFDAPLVVDSPIQETVAGAPLTTWQKLALNQTNEFGWRLRRIVGDIFIGVQAEDTQAINFPGVLIQAGIIVRRVGDAGTPIVPASDSTVGSIKNESDPWVWRRNWHLASNARTNGQTPVQQAVNAFPSTTVAYGTKHHIAIDQKTARRLGPEERLFLNVTAWETPLNQPGSASTATDTRMAVYFLMPYRVLGSVITVAGNRRNASR